MPTLNSTVSDSTLNNVTLEFANNNPIAIVIGGVYYLALPSSESNLRHLQKMTGTFEEHFLFDSVNQAQTYFGFDGVDKTLISNLTSLGYEQIIFTFDSNRFFSVNQSSSAISDLIQNFGPMVVHRAVIPGMTPAVNNQMLEAYFGKVQILTRSGFLATENRNLFNLLLRNSDKPSGMLGPILKIDTTLDHSEIVASGKTSSSNINQNLSRYQLLTPGAIGYKEMKRLIPSLSQNYHIFENIPEQEKLFLVDSSQFKDLIKLGSSLFLGTRESLKMGLMDIQQTQYKNGNIYLSLGSNTNLENVACNLYKKVFEARRLNMQQIIFADQNWGNTKFGDYIRHFCKAYTTKNMYIDTY